MPIYEYVCDRGHRFEVIHGIHDAGPTECPVCHSTAVRKAFVPPAIHFKGSGWAKKDRTATSRPGTSSTDSKTSDTSSASTTGGDAASTATPAPKEPEPKTRPASKGESA